MQTTPIQVEIIGSWWNNLLPLVAIILSLGTLVWTIWDRNRALARIAADSQGMSWDPNEGPPERNKGTVDIAVRNRGRVDATVVSSITLEIPMEKTKFPVVLVEPTKLSHDLPGKIEPGETFVFGFDLEAIAAHTLGDMSALRRSRYKVRSGHGDISRPLPRDVRQYIEHFAPIWRTEEK